MSNELARIQAARARKPARVVAMDEDDGFAPQGGFAGGNYAAAMQQQQQQIGAPRARVQASGGVPRVGLTIKYNKCQIY